jgi:hypothetical protein
VSAVAEERRYGEPFVCHRDVMASSLSAVNAVVLLELKTVNTQLVRNDTKSRFWRTILVDWTSDGSVPGNPVLMCLCYRRMI